MGNPLIDALKYKKSMGAGSRPAMEHIDPQSQGHHGVLAFHQSKVPNLANAKSGDKVTVKVHGSVHSVDEHGNMTMHAHDVKPDSEEMTEKENPPQGESPMVRLQTEHG